MTDQVYQLLTGPRKTRYKIEQLKARRQALRYSMLPGGIRYDIDKVQTSPSDMMPEKMGELAELEEKIQRLEALHRRQIEDIETACSKLSDELQRTVIMMFYVGGIPVRGIAETLHYTAPTIYKARRQGQTALDKILSGE